jgi:serine/threonine protein kinase
MALTTGSKVGTYEILGPIGAGGMGEVYRAKDTRLPREAAIKVSALKFSERFAREAHVIASLNHPNITTLYDIGPDYLVMELVDGPTLADRIKQGSLTLDEASNIARQIADALDYAHERGVVHRDLKPGNIKIRPDGVVKVSISALPSRSLARWPPLDPMTRRRSPHPQLARAWCSARRPTCRRNRPRARRWTDAPTSGPSAACYTRC